ncbi:Polygalacturonase-1 non-catalytic subunit beta [Heracleum sosnowskyi]|uniref:Polygalacturonase-1 non-catalytic subunit beta n=1 Tax=Heracleum sosnowskyi TaxID=360622 RepID=A0AAD8MQY9_9APIA|nr:Polygalacturonase-1 non-catalytic subunit beta [Heracleum sosnowskyi]
MNELKLITHLFILLSSIFFFLNLSVVGAHRNLLDSPTGESPFSPKGSLLRYWKKQVSNDLPKPDFLIKKASPLTAVQTASFSKLADQNTLSTKLSSFCSSAKLLCFPDLSPSLEKHDQNVAFSSYSEKNFTNYGTLKGGDTDSFQKYGDGENIPVTTFRRYGRDSVGHDTDFTSYATEANVVDQSFNSYAAGSTGGASGFSTYSKDSNVPNLNFNSYSADSNGQSQKFTAYTEEANSGAQNFASYGKDGNGQPNNFENYGKDSNVIGSTFSGYGQNANGAANNFTSYGFNGNVPENKFKNYGDTGNGAVETFTSYRDKSNVGDDSFESYAKNSNAAKATFSNYGQSFNEGSDKFTGYGKKGSFSDIGFKKYGVNNTFKDYANKKDVKFSTYATKGSAELASLKEGNAKVVNKWVEPGKFFREKMLKSGTVMPMPDIKDKMPERAFLPRVLSSKLPFSTTKLDELKKLFHASDNSSMEGMIVNSLTECERAPSRGETKRCVGSIEDMLDFATSVLGRNVVVRTTENTKGSKEDIMIGEVKGINGGKVTKSVSCHQSLYPYLMYYCHSVPKVRVYEADILDSKTKVKINHGVAICHVDTSDWSASHGAFAALGSAPGKIEVCHWIFENDMNWATAD